MAGDPKRRVLPGEPLVIPAQIYNDLLASLDGRQPPGRREGNRRVTQSGIVRVLNTTGSQIVLLFSVVGLNDPIIDPADNLGEFKSEVTFRGVIPGDPSHRGRFGILIEPADTDAVARAVVSGVVQVRLRPANDADVQEFAEVADGQTGYLVDSATGSARIIWEAGGTGERWAVVRLGEKPHGASATSLELDEVNGSTDSVTDVTKIEINYGDGGDLTNPATGTARINFLAASATQKGMVDLSDQYLGAGIKTADVLAIAKTAGTAANNDAALRVDTAGPIGFTYSVLSCQQRNSAGDFGDISLSASALYATGIAFDPDPDSTNVFSIAPSGTSLLRIRNIAQAPGYGLWFQWDCADVTLFDILHDEAHVLACSGYILAHKFGIAGSPPSNPALIGDSGTLADGSTVVGGIITNIAGGSFLTAVNAGTGITVTPSGSTVTVAVDTGASLTWTVGQTYEIASPAITVKPPDLVSDGTADSPYFVWQAQGYATATLTRANWEALADATSGAGASTWTLRHHLNAGAPTNLLTITDAGNGTFTGTLAASNLSGTNTGDQLVFKTIAVSGQSDVVADSTTDTLTLAAGTGITITTNATTDTVTIASTATGTNTGDQDLFASVTMAGSGTVNAASTTDDLEFGVGNGLSGTLIAVGGGARVTYAVSESYAHVWTSATGHVWFASPDATLITLEGSNVGSPVTDKSPHLLWIAKSYDSSQHTANWESYVATTSQAGASTFHIRSRIDAGSFTDRFTITDAGNGVFAGTVAASNLSGTNTGDQTITLTGDVTGSGTGSFATTIGSHKIQDGMIRQGAARSVLGVGGNAIADIGDIVVNSGTDAVLRESSGTLAFGTVATAGIANNAIADSKLRDCAALSVIGRSANSAGDPADISASASSDAVLRESGSTVGFGTVATGGIADNAVTDAKLRQGTACSLVGRSANSSGNVADIAISANNQMLVRRSNVIASEAVGFRLKTVTVLSSGSGATYSTPAGVLALLVELIGGGASGGGVSGAASNSAASGGGGSGGYARKLYSAPVSSYTYTVGTGGSAPTAGANNGNNGNATTWNDGSTTVTANGGNGGGSMAFGTSVNLSQPGGGAAISTNGDVNAGGSPGGPGIRTASNAGVGGNGGSGPFGGGGSGVVNVGAGAAGSGPGSGGAGAVTKDATNRSGGAGSDGVIIVWEFY